MVIKSVSQVGSAVIRAKAKPVTSLASKATRKIAADLIDSMRHHELVGMAAPQIGKSVRVFVTEIRRTKVRKTVETDVLRVFINPRIQSLSKKRVKSWEGCGSVADGDLFGQTSRSASLTIKAQDLDGESFTLTAMGLLARVIQHEMDHLNGKVFTDTANPRTYMSRNEYVKMKKRNK